MTKITGIIKLKRCKPKTKFQYFTGALISDQLKHKEFDSPRITNRACTYFGRVIIANSP